MSKNLMTAHREWATRPADQCFWTTKDMYVAALAFHYGHDVFDPAGRSGNFGIKTCTGNYNKLRLAVTGEGKPSQQDLVLTVPNIGVESYPTNWGFKRLCYDLHADASFLSTCDAEDVASILNKRLAVQPDARQVRLMRHLNGRDELLAVSTKTFGSVTNHELIKWVIQHPFFEKWVTPPARPSSNDNPNARPATKADITNTFKGEGLGGLQVKVGDMIAPSGNWLSKEDMCILKVNEEARLDDGTDGGLARGFMMGNSEVGKRSVWGLLFEYREICGNLIVWDVRNVLRMKSKHSGKGAKHRAFHRLEKMLQNYSQRSARLDEARIKVAKNTRIIEGKMLAEDLREDTAQWLYNKKLLSLNFATQAVAMAEKYGPDEKTDPFSFWGIANGITRASQNTLHFDKRLAKDGAAGRLLELLKMPSEVAASN